MTDRRSLDGMLAARILAEYAEQPGLALTLAQAARLFHLDRDTCARVLVDLVHRQELRKTAAGQYRRA